MTLPKCNRCRALLLVVSVALLACRAFASSFEVADLERKADSILRALQRTQEASGKTGRDQAQKEEELHVELAATLHMLNTLHPDGGSRVDAAVDAYKSAVHLAELRDDRVSVAQHKGNLGALLIEAGRPGEALEWIEEVLDEAEDPEPRLQQFRLLLFNKGKALAALGRMEESEQAYRGAAAWAHGKLLSTYGKAAAAMQGMPDALLVQVLLVMRQLGLNVLSNSAVSSAPSDQAEEMRRLRSQVDALEASEKAQKRAESASSPGEDMGQITIQDDWLHAPGNDSVAWLCFAAHKGLHGRRLYASAWAALQHGNNHMAVANPYDPTQDLRSLQIIKSVFTRRFSELGPGYQPKKPPIFIVGVPRSGSTLLESLLAARSDVVAAGEDTLLAPLTEAIKQVLLNLGPDSGKKLTELGARYLETMCQRFVTEGRQCDQVHLVDKNLRNQWSVGYIDLILPKACIVHVTRHPLDTALSCYSHPFLSPLLSWSWTLDGISQYVQAAWQLSKHWERALPGRVLTVYYEELVKHPETVLRRVTSHCGLPWEDGVLQQFHSHKRVISTASVAQVRQPLYQTSVGQWQHYRDYLAPLRAKASLGKVVKAYEKRLSKVLAAHETQNSRPEL